MLFKIIKFNLINFILFNLCLAEIRHAEVKTLNDFIKGANLKQFKSFYKSIELTLEEKYLLLKSVTDRLILENRSNLLSPIELIKYKGKFDKFCYKFVCGLELISILFSIIYIPKMYFLHKNINHKIEEGRRMVNDYINMSNCPRTTNEKTRYIAFYDEKEGWFWEWIPLTMINLMLYFLTKSIDKSISLSKRLKKLSKILLLIEIDLARVKKT